MQANGNLTTFYIRDFSLASRTIQEDGTETMIEHHRGGSFRELVRVIMTAIVGYFVLCGTRIFVFAGDISRATCYNQESLLDEKCTSVYKALWNLDGCLLPKLRSIAPRGIRGLGPNGLEALLQRLDEHFCCPAGEYMNTLCVISEEANPSIATLRECTDQIRLNGGETG